VCPSWPAGFCPAIAGVGAAREDFHFREKLFHFDHERIPERVVHARGFGAHGFFENYEPLGELTRADLLATTCRCSSSRTR